ncbi:MAG: hypothetical protein JO093_08715 [Acidobacteria bacterium]|nr:hypothetical protein [Acidobacteriota bacterium]MBV9069401.1 hypothetical protein [Acidobacteriota bacterium]MBV9185692.1 hypothetical protein [Acidobacteriota bacterium]
MPKILKLAFTGNAVLTPEYPENLQPIDGPLYAVMPGARRVRQSDFPNNQINAQLAFLTFPYRNLVVEVADDRDADYKHPDIRDTKTGLCFLQREHLFISPHPLENKLTFDDSAATDFPTKTSTGVKYVAQWSHFADGGGSALKKGFLSGDGDYVRVQIDGGEVSASFVGEPIALIDFDYGQNSDKRAYAQEIVITMTYPDETEFFQLQSRPFTGEAPGPSALKFYWYDSPEIKILFGNGSLASINSVLSGSFAGNNHEGDYDLEFEVLYNVVDVKPDQLGRLPLPQIVSSEILHVPCVASMVSPPKSTETPTTLALPKASAASGLTQAPREPGEPRRRPSSRTSVLPKAQAALGKSQALREPGASRPRGRKP